MKAAPFDYVRVSCMEEIQDIFAAFGDDAQVIAGGQSLIPAMAMRMARPKVLLDIAHMKELGGISETDEGIRLGAMTRYVELRDCELLSTHAPLIGKAVPLIAHEAIRSRGTIGGSLAHADPASEMPAVMQALGAVFNLHGVKGPRGVAATDFFQGTYATVLDPGEIIVSITIPFAPKGRLSGIREFARRSGDYAAAGGAFVLDVEHTRITQARLVFFGVADRAMLAPKASECLRGQQISALDLQPVLEALTADIEPMADLHNSAATKQHLMGVLTRRLFDDLMIQHRPAHG